MILHDGCPPPVVRSADSSSIGAAGLRAARRHCARSTRHAPPARGRCPRAGTVSRVPVPHSADLAPVASH
eukprot:1672301-Pyramimonas_sp.AAC.1